MATEREMPVEDATDFASIPGEGIAGIVAGRAVVMGNGKLMADRNVDFGDLLAQADGLRKDGATALFLGVDGRPGGIIAVADPIKPTTVGALKTLRAAGIHIVMLTGDNRTTAEAVARKLGIADFEADVLPEDKNRIVRKLRAEGKIVAMAGDGVNDAPALAEADVGIAMGTGTEVAIRSAGLTLVADADIIHRVAGPDPFLFRRRRTQLSEISAAVARGAAAQFARCRQSGDDRDIGRDGIHP